ncbi:MAG TPA: alpha-L-arabinofuranosidase C-terminal domain-containing protein [Bryobacteraceae bacterium]|jgi:alpha-N-arabinofuranosidase|nr:alpha-L-arabinofuranosidase C-terminal domain-containing protein [Bryobacteraceae bacterium]
MPRVVSRFHVSLPLLAFVLSLSAQEHVQPPPAAALDIQARKPVAKVSPSLYGLMTEEINYSYDGGLYAEMVRNRTFQDSHWDLPAWSLVQSGNSIASVELDKSTGPSTALPLSLKLTVKAADSTNQAGIKNSGFWGFAVRPETMYRGSFYAKAANASTGPVTVSLLDDNTGAAVATAAVPSLSADWQRYTVALKTGRVRTSAANHLVLTVARPGTVWFDLVSLFPPTYKDRANGNRIDLMEKLAAMKPAFLRFPGGNYLEGDHISERYEWKKTIGPLVDRPTHPSPWHYHSSDGMGLLEFLEWCEDLHMQPVLAVYAGYSMMQEHVAPGSDLEPYIQDALDEIEYVTGDTSTKWGAVRTRDGHPEPFLLNFVEIGNEDFFDKSGSYDGRYAQFYAAIKKKYPQLQLIATTPVKSIKPDVIDDHFYRRPEEFFDDTHHYDQTDRNGPKIFVGEWATREGTPTPDFGAALGDAAWMTGMERNSDIVIMASYAPLFVNVNPGGMQWETDLIGYNTLTSYGSPSYYAQVMFSNHIGDEIVESNLEGGGPRLFYSVTRDAAKGLLYVKLVNASSLAQAIDIKLNGASEVKSAGTLISLSAKTPDETNSIAEPTKIVPVRSPLSNMGPGFRHTLPPYSIHILEIALK